MRVASLVAGGFLKRTNNSSNMYRLVLRLVLLFGLLNAINTSPRRVQKIKLDPNYLKAMSAYRKLEPKITTQELKTITTIGILNGAMKAEKEMAKHLTDIVTDLILNTNMSDKPAAMAKITKIEQTIERDKNAVQILTSAMDLATKTLSMKDYREQLEKTLEEHKSRKREIGNHKDVDMGRLRASILDHLHSMQETISSKIDSTLDYLRENKELDGIRANRKRSAMQENSLQTLFEEDKLENNLVAAENQPITENDKDVNITVDIGTNDFKWRQKNPYCDKTTANIAIDGNKKANQIEESGEGIDIGAPDGEMPPSGLVGLIASLSGGEGGSDVGALIGALTGVISQLFGPGGLDIESLISTGTSLIAGLLAGDRNFGTVIGEYVGTAFDGLSGGGGAINNGKFIGNLLGTIVASLSANPEDDDLPPQPLVFVQSLIQSFGAAKNRAGAPDNGEAPPAPAPLPVAGSDSFGFIKQIVSALVGGVTSFVLNASVGASGGSSQASTSASASSSQPKAPHKPAW